MNFFLHTRATKQLNRTDINRHVIAVIVSVEEFSGCQSVTEVEKKHNSPREWMNEEKKWQVDGNKSRMLRTIDTLIRIFMIFFLLLPRLRCLSSLCYKLTWHFKMIPQTFRVDIKTKLDCVVFFFCTLTRPRLRPAISQRSHTKLSRFTSDLTWLEVDSLNVLRPKESSKLQLFGVCLVVGCRLLFRY